jgi:hypothetical protein
MDMDDDFVGEIEFDLSPEQGELVSRAISVASTAGDNEFMQINPLIAIMRWWEAHVPEDQKLRDSPETTLVDACRRFLLAHERGLPSIQ